jgi:hypothetical protein
VKKGDGTGDGISDFMTKDLSRKVVGGLGLPKDPSEDLFSNSHLLLRKIGCSF